QRLAERLVEGFGLVPRRCVGEVRSSSLLSSAIRDQRELRYDEHGTAGVEQRAVELALLLLEDPQIRDLGGEPFRLGGCVPPGDADEDTQPRADLAAGRDGRARHPLDDRSQLSMSITREA